MQQRPYNLKSLKYLLPGPLQKVLQPQYNTLINAALLVVHVNSKIITLTVIVFKRITLKSTEILYLSLIGHRLLLKLGFCIF